MNIISSLSSLLGAVSMVGFEQGLFSVKDGNKGIPESLLAASKATLVKAKVTTLALVKEGGTGTSLQCSQFIIVG